MKDIVFILEALCGEVVAKCSPLNTTEVMTEGAEDRSGGFTLVRERVTKDRKGVGWGSLGPDCLLLFLNIELNQLHKLFGDWGHVWLSVRGISKLWDIWAKARSKR